MNNLLSLKIKSIKRELLALKTAHIKGIGNLKVYSQSLKIIPSPGHSLLSIIVDFDSSTAPYPFVQVFGSLDPDMDPTFAILGGGYTNNGYTSITTGTGFVLQDVDMIYVEATSPIQSVTYRWGN